MEEEKSAIFPLPFHTIHVSRNLSFFTKIWGNSHSDKTSYSTLRLEDVGGSEVESQKMMRLGVIRIRAGLTSGEMAS